MSMFLQGKMVEHLNQIDRAATERMELLVVKLTERQGVTERLKAEDQLLWVGMMNNIRSAAEEIVLRELIYAQIMKRKLSEDKRLADYIQ